MSRFNVRRLLLAVAVFGGLTIPAVLIGWKHWSFGRDFDAEVWQDQVAIHEARRQAMAARFIADGTLIGKTRAEVIEMFGDTYYRMVDPPWRLPEWDLIYPLGPNRGILKRSDSEWLVIRFGADGRVTEYRVVRD